MNRTSQIKIRRIFNNENSTKDQVTVQFAQQVEGNGNPLLALTQGITGTGMITCLTSFARTQAVALFGTDDFTAPDVENFDTYMEVPEALRGMGISVVENTEKNPKQPSQQPKIDPRNNEVLAFNGKPIYRHTELAVTPDQLKTELLAYTDRLPAGTTEESVVHVAADQKVVA